MSPLMNNAQTWTRCNLKFSKKKNTTPKRLFDTLLNGVGARQRVRQIADVLTNSVPTRPRRLATLSITATWHGLDVKAAMDATM